MTSKKLNVLSVVGVVVVVSGFVFGLLMPGVRQLRDVRQQIATEQQAVALRQAEVGDISALYKRLMDLTDDVSSFRQRLPADRRMGEFLNDLSDAMMATGIRDFHVQPLPATRVEADELPDRLKLADGTGVLPVEIAFRSNFEKAFELLDAIEVLPRLAYVERFEVKAEGELTGQLSVTMVVQAFHHDHQELIGRMPKDLAADGQAKGNKKNG